MKKEKQNAILLLLSIIQQQNHMVFFFFPCMILSHLSQKSNQRISSSLYLHLF